MSAGLLQQLSKLGSINSPEAKKLMGINTSREFDEFLLSNLAGAENTGWSLRDRADYLKEPLKYMYGGGLGMYQRYTPPGGMELPGPIPWDESSNLTYDEMVELAEKHPEVLLKKMEDFKSNWEDRISNYEKRLKECIDRSGDTNGCKAEASLLEGSKKSLKDLEDARSRLYPSDEQMQLDPMIYLDEDQYAPWVVNKAKKLISGED